MSFQQEDVTIEATGEVKGPPALADIIARLEEAQDLRESVILTTGEARVLTMALAEGDN